MKPSRLEVSHRNALIRGAKYFTGSFPASYHLTDLPKPYESEEAQGESIRTPLMASYDAYRPGPMRQAKVNIVGEQTQACRYHKRYEYPLVLKCASATTECVVRRSYQG